MRRPRDSWSYLRYVPNSHQKEGLDEGYKVKGQPLIMLGKEVSGKHCNVKLNIVHNRPAARLVNNLVGNKYCSWWDGRKYVNAILTLSIMLSTTLSDLS